MTEELIIKQMTTIMIGSIAAIEEHFGHLFGQDKRSDLSESEIENKKQFLKIRKQILDLGNNQITKIKDEFKK